MIQSPRRGEPDLPPGPARDLVDLLRRLRLIAGISPSKLATVTGLSRSYVSEVLAGWKAPRPDTAERLVTGLRGDRRAVLLARRLAEQLAELNRHQRRRQAAPRPGRSGLRIMLLGPVVVERDGTPVELGNTAKAVLAVLAMRADAGVTTEELVASVWGSRGAVTRDSVYHYVGKLRAALTLTGEPAVIESSDGRYRLRIADHAVDVRQFRDLLRHARQAMDRQEPQSAAHALHQALDRFRGQPLGGVAGDPDGLRQRLEDERWVCVETLAAIEQGCGKHLRVVDLLRVECARSPEREGVAALMIGSLAAVGRRDEATAVYLRTRAALRETTGLEPGAALESAFRAALRTGDPGAGPPASPSTPSPPSRHPATPVFRRDRHFTGREADVARLVGKVRHGSQAVLVHGMPGVGKTALVAQAAEEMSGSFPDGVVLLDLHGYTGTRAPLGVGAAVERLLRRLIEDPARIPVDTDDQVDLYQTVLAGRRLLIVLDNVRDAGQVRPLLPAVAGSAVLLTSRRRLRALDDVDELALDVLPPAAGAALFQSVSGADGQADGPVIDRIVALCGGLPLAIRIVAARHTPANRHSLDALEARLSDAHAVSTELAQDDRSVAASFRVSLDDLPMELRRMCALAALHPGASYDVHSVAALLGTGSVEALRRLDEVADRHLIERSGDDRYQFHDLILRFVREHPATRLSDVEIRSALRRLADYAVRACLAADVLITPHRHHVPPDADDTAELPALGDYDAALAWFRTEEPGLTAICLTSGAAGLDESCWQLAYALRGYYHLAKLWGNWRHTYEVARRSARRCGDRLATALITDNLGRVHLELGDPATAERLYRIALRLFVSVGDEHGANTARADLAWLHFSERRFDEFVDAVGPVLAHYRAAKAERNAAITQRGLGLATANLGRYDESVVHLESALEVFERLGLRVDAAMTWNGLGETFQHAGQHGRAVASYLRAVEASDRSGSMFERARARAHLGELAHSAGDREVAARYWTEALEDYRHLGASQQDAVQRALDGLADG